MKLFTFEIAGQRRLGAECNGLLVDLQIACAAMIAARGANAGALKALPTDMLAFIRLGAPALDAARATLAFMARRPALPVGERATYLIDEVKIFAPIPRPGKILCAMTNSNSDADKNPDATNTAEPRFFVKLPSSVIGPGEPIVVPKALRHVNCGVQFAVVIGNRMKHAPESDVMDRIFGYTILNDVSAYHGQFSVSQYTLGRNFDTFCPLGPCIVTTDEFTRAESVKVHSFVNGELRQAGATSDCASSVPRLLSFLSSVTTLEPGDVVSAGTPSGVGVSSEPHVFVSRGDVVRLEVDGIGVLENSVVDEGNPDLRG